MHEYGHTIDSRRYGPAYLFAIGVSSLNSAAKSTYWNEISPTTGHYYTRSSHDIYWTEKRANKNASKYFDSYYNVSWNTLYKNGTYENYYPL